MTDHIPTLVSSMNTINKPIPNPYPMDYRSYIISYEPRKRMPFVVFDSFNPYQPVIRKPTGTACIAWIDKRWDKAMPNMVGAV